MSDLPDAWTEVRFGEINSFFGTSVDPSASPAERFELYSVPTFPTRTPEFLLGADIGSTKQAVRPNDVLVCKINPRINRVWQVMPLGAHRQIASSEWIVMRAEGLNPTFLRHYFSSPAFREHICEGVTGVGGSLTRAQPKRVSQFPVPIAPLAEQKRIADKLDRLLAHVDACQGRLERVRGILKRFRQSVLATATRGELTREWREERGIPPPMATTLGDVLKVSSGKFLPAKAMAPGGTIPVFGGNGVNGYHDKANVEEETVVIGRVGFYCGSVHLTPPQAWVTDNALIVHHDSSRILRRFLYYALQAVDLRVNDSSTAQPVISGAKIYPTSIAIPDFLEQVEIVGRLDVLLELAENLEKQHATVASSVSRIVPSILEKAFRGKLAPQDPRDEPASKLIGRLRTRSSPASNTGKSRHGGARAPLTKAKAGTNMLTRKDVTPTHLTTILKERGPLTAEALWNASQLEIDDFYDQLKDEEARGLLRENRGDAPNAPRLLEPAA